METRAYVADGMGSDLVNFHESQWEQGPLHVTIRPISVQSGTTPLNWLMTLQALEQLSDYMRMIEGYRAMNADILVLQHWGPLRRIGEFRLFGRDRELEANSTNDTLTVGMNSLALSNDTITADNISAPPLTIGEGVALRYGQAGAALDYFNVMNLFLGAIGTADDNVKRGKGNDPISWVHLKYQGKQMRLLVTIDQRAMHRLTWRELVNVEMMMIGQMRSHGYAELRASIVYQDESGQAMEVIGELEVVKDDVPATTVNS